MLVRLKIGLVDVLLVKAASVLSYVKFASPCIALDPVTVTTVLLVDPVRVAPPLAFSHATAAPAPPEVNT